MLDNPDGGGACLLLQDAWHCSTENTANLLMFLPPGKGVSGHTRVFRAAQVAGKWWGAVCTWSHRPRPGDRSSCHSQRLLFPRVVPARRAAGQPAERAGSGYNSSHQGAAADTGDRLNKHRSPLLIPTVRLKQARVCASLCCSWCVHGAGWSLCR